jgi:LmbE family N-acetylglucosaminyl deacetylase
VAHAEILDYPDGQLEAQPFNAVVARLTGVMRRWRPHVVLTFGPDGGLTAHRDHAMTSHFATAAFHAAPRPHGLPDEPRPYRPQKLYFATAMVTTPGRGPTAPAPAGTRIEVADLVHAKIAAFRAHESQAALRPVVERVLRRHGTEWFHLAACVRPSEARLETDLFEGIVEDDERSPQ